ncbi:MAG: two-component system chemotaxis response regulator CheV [Oceanicoccus sp.]
MIVETDGYRLTTEIRADQALKDLHTVLHASLSGSFNLAMVKNVGCDGFLTKFQAEALSKLVPQRVRDR